MPDNPKLGGYQQMLSADIFRGRYREDFAVAKPIAAGKVLAYRIPLPHASHTFLRGHRIMVQVQSSWFPLYDRNPQTFVPNIMFAKPESYVKATQRIWRTPEFRERDRTAGDPLIHLRSLAALAALLAAHAVHAQDPAAAPAPVACPESAESSRIFTLTLGGNRAGFQTECRMAAGVREYIFEFNDRGRGPAVRSRIELDAKGVPVSLTVDGHDYLKSAIAERFAVTDGRATWTNKVEQGELELDAPAFYLSQSGVPSETALLARALLASPDAKLPLLPLGESRIEKLEERTVRVGEQSRRLTLYAITGLGFQPGPIWLDEDGELFAVANAWLQVVVEGWESVVQSLLDAQEAQMAAARRAQSAKLRRVPAGPLAIIGATVFDAEARKMLPGTTVLIEGEHDPRGRRGRDGGDTGGHGTLRRRRARAAAGTLGHAHSPGGRGRAAAPGGGHHGRARHGGGTREARTDAHLGDRRNAGTPHRLCRHPGRTGPVPGPDLDARGQRGRCARAWCARSRAPDSSSSRSTAPSSRSSCLRSSTRRTSRDCASAATSRRS